MKKIVKIMKINFIIHNVKSFIIQKPKNYNFIPGQATEVSINNELKKEKRPFTLTSTNEDLVLEFTIKRYDGITSKIHELKSGDELIIREPFGSIHYEDKGVFIAGGAGITPFLSIFRSLKKEIEGNKLIFSNKKNEDLICERELQARFGENVKFLLTDEKREGYSNERIDEGFLKREIKNFNQYFYICGPPAFVQDIKKDLIKLGVKEDKIIFEK
jgi:ferredoxin-NADP reductase